MAQAHVHDPESLWAARFEIRKAHAAIGRLHQSDPSIRETLTRLDALCAELTIELETIEPRLELV